jgi:hypothetical protein
LNKYKYDLQNGIYKIIVSGTLSFQQDIFFSKIFDSNYLVKKSKSFKPKYDREPEDAYLEAPFVLSRTEIQNATLTSELLNIIKKVYTNNEWYKIQK